MKLLMLLLLVLILSVSAAAPKSRGAGVEFPNIPDVPVPEGMSYGGFFEKHSPVKLVFGVSDPGEQMKESLTNAAYTIKYLKPRGVPYKIQFVFYGKAVLATSLFTEQYGGFGPLMEALHQEGVEFRVCHNSMHALGVQVGDLYPYMSAIPAGILQIAKKQMQGYSYISNR
jgi:intracellular sulfur oxidation DsrE/DsrF family protein